MRKLAPFLACSVAVQISRSFLECAANVRLTETAVPEFRHEGVHDRYERNTRSAQPGAKANTAFRKDTGCRQGFHLCGGCRVELFGHHRSTGCFSWNATFASLSA